MQTLRRQRLVRGGAQIAAGLVLLCCIGSWGPGSWWDGTPDAWHCVSRMPGCNALGLPDATACELLLGARATAPPRRAPHAAAVPRTIHQSWKTDDVPERFQLWYQSWRDANPGWEHRLWTDADNRDLVRRRYPWLLPVYDALPVPVMRADAARYLYMHAHGGVYADLDTWALRGMDNLTAQPAGAGSGGALVGLMSEDVDFPHNIPNAWMASAPGHPFWLFVARAVAEAARRAMHASDSGEMKAEEATGPVALKRAYDTWRCVLGEEAAGVAALPAGYVFVSDWHDEAARAEFDAACDGARIASPVVQLRCRHRYPNAHVLTYWTHSWEVPWWEKDKKDGAGGGRTTEGDGGSTADDYDK